MTVSDNHSNPGSLPITPVTWQTRSIPPSTAPPSDLSDWQNSEPDLPSANRKGENKRKSGDAKIHVLISSILTSYTFSNIQPSGTGDTAQTDWDEHGMYRDVNVMDIHSSSDWPDPAKKNKNKNPTTDADHFFHPVKHLNGDKRGRRRCRSCM